MRSLVRGGGDEPAAVREDAPSPPAGPPGRRMPPPLAVAGLAALVLLPLAVALVSLRHPRWYPMFDMAMTELKVRDVGSANPPLVGLAGRITQNGSHPGPLVYWFMWPVYRLFGGSSFGLMAASVWVHATAAVAALWLARRRAGTVGLLGVAALLAVLVHAYGPLVFTEAWNPYLPVLWWVVLLLALWSVLAGDLPALPLAVFAGSIGAQTHLPYLLLAVGMGVVTLVAVAVAVLARRRGSRAAGGGTEPGTRSTRWWLAVGGALLGILWLPPVLDQLLHDPGNIGVLLEHFRSPSGDPVGLAEGVRLVLIRLNPLDLLGGVVALGSFPQAGPTLPGLVLLAVWGAAVGTAWRAGRSDLLRLHLLLAAAMALAVLAASRIWGPTWNYLLLWVWGTGGLLVLASVWTFAAALAAPTTRRPVAPPVAMVLAGVAVVWTGLGVADAVGFELDHAGWPVRATQIGELATQVAADAEGRGDADAPHLVTWADPTHLGLGWGLLLELEREGLDVATTANLRATVGPDRVTTAGRAAAHLHLAVGPAIDDWAARAGVREVARSDPRSAAGRAEQDRLLAEVATRLRAEGRSELAATTADNPFATAGEFRLPPAVRPAMERVVAIGFPVAVFDLTGVAAAGGT
jgi:hypothetical protein